MVSILIMCPYIYIIHIINAAAFPDVIASGFRGAQLTVLKLSKGKVIFTWLFSHLHYTDPVFMVALHILVTLS